MNLCADFNPRLCRLCACTSLRQCAQVLAADITSLYREDLAVDLTKIECMPSSESYVLVQCEACALKQFFPDWVAGPALYAALQNRPWYYVAEKSEFQLAGARVKPGQQVLELGCGSGHFQAYLPTGVRYVGLDTNAAAVAIARSAGLDVRLGDLQDFGAEHLGAFDVVCAFQVLEHVPQPRVFLIEMAAMLKPGGLLILSVPGDDSFVGQDPHNVLNMPPHHCTRWPDATLSRLGEFTNLQLVDLLHEPLSQGHVRAVARQLVWRCLESAARSPSGGLLIDVHSKAMRRLVTALSLPLRPILRLAAPLRRGHTTSVVLRRA